MTSKLERQKHILSLLNSKSIPQPGRESDLLPPEIRPAADELSRRRLANQIYQFHKSIIQNINAGLITLDLDGEITFANKIAAWLLGYEVEELLGQDFKRFFKSPEEADKFLSLCTLPGKKIDNWESEFLHKSDQKLIVGINSSYLEDAANGFEGVVLLLRDLTEVQQLRNQVERMERLALLGELSAGIAHEVRNPLAGIKAATQLLEENFAASELQKQVVQRIVREVDKANRLLKEFFKFARPTRPRPGFIHIEKIVDSVYLLLAPRLKKSGISFEEHFPSRLPQIYADETQVEQVILNLFLNAIEAMPAGGALKVSASKKSLTILDPGKTAKALPDQNMDYVLLEIADTGTGIAPENLDKIFNPFFTTKSEGLGLGLAICSRLIQENNGKIDVASQAGAGTTIVVALPTFTHR